MSAFQRPPREADESPEAYHERVAASKRAFDADRASFNAALLRTKSNLKGPPRSPSDPWWSPLALLVVSVLVLLGIFRLFMLLFMWFPSVTIFPTW